MAKYNCVFRTSYFCVTDEKAYEEFKNHIDVYGSMDDIKFWHKHGDCMESDDVKFDTDKPINHAFGGYTQIRGYEDIYNYDSKLEYQFPDYNLFLSKLSEIVAPNSACIITEIGNNALRFLGAKVDVVTHKNYRTFTLQDIVRDSLIKEENLVCNYDDMWF